MFHLINVFLNVKNQDGFPMKNVENEGGRGGFSTTTVKSASIMNVSYSGSVTESSNFT